MLTRELSSQCAERYPRFVSFLRDRSRQVPETPPHLRALPQSLQALLALISRIVILRRAIDHIEEFLATATTPGGTEVRIPALMPNHLLTLSSGNRHLASP
jgi:hypothetical protein